ncbi:hypothetical protein SSS_04130 [Sarcoptes scabiei]|uniref:Uncharacterized protein n=1 Tax=Sarcoptes scabiei TaxID=52283 RepID=A0A834R6I2_SARSC|nr:hypothetical protein SSS_04130 [Sarcoptes scabiei]
MVASETTTITTTTITTTTISMFGLIESQQQRQQQQHHSHYHRQQSKQQQQQQQQQQHQQQQRRRLKSSSNRNAGTSSRFNSFLQRRSLQHQQQPIKCDEIKQCSRMFREATLSHNLSYDLSSEKIEHICVKLNRAVQCFNNYRRMCINDHFQHSKITADFFDQMSEGPLGLTMELCNNSKFKQDYLTLGPCQKKYRGELDQCLTVNHRNSYGSNTSNSTILEQFIEHCCLDKCGKDAAEFSLKILELFNRGYLRECAKYANLSYLCVRENHHSQRSSASSSWSISSDSIDLFDLNNHHWIISILFPLIFFWINGNLFCPIK